MAQYHIKFVGTLIEQFRPEGHPKTVFADTVEEANNANELRQVTNKNLVYMIRNSGMIVQKDPTRIRSTEYEPDQAIFYPMHMIARIDTITTLIVNVPENSSGGLN